MSNEKVIVGVTASFDSIATLLLLKLQNYEVIAVHVVLAGHDPAKLVNTKDTLCLNQYNKSFIEELCSEIGVPVYFVDQKEFFYDSVIEAAVLANFMKEFHATCLACHKVRLLCLYNNMLKFNATYMATGHYAKLRKSGQEGIVSLYESNSKELDQHKLLAGVDQTILTKLLLPLSDLNRDKAIAIVKEHLPNHHSMLTSGSKQGFCSVITNQVSAFKKMIPPSMNKKSRVFTRKSKTYMNEAMDSSEFEFGQTLKMGRGRNQKDQTYTITGFNYSYQAIYVSEQENSTVNYFFVQITEFFGKPSLHEPSNSMVSLNDESHRYEATVYYKSLNYALVVLKSEEHAYIPNKSILYIFEDNKQGSKLCYLTRVVSQGKVEEGNIPAIFKLSKLEGDYPF